MNSEKQIRSVVTRGREEGEQRLEEVNQKARTFSNKISTRDVRGRRQWHPTPVLLLENPMDGGAWWAAVHGVARVGHD